MERREDERRRGDKERERPKETDTNTVEKREGESTMQPCKKRKREQRGGEGDQYRIVPLKDASASTPTILPFPHCAVSPFSPFPQSPIPLFSPTQSTFPAIGTRHMEPPVPGEKRGKKRHS